jgi:hypothetical protein
MTARDWLADRLVMLAAARLQRSHPEWALAVQRESEYLTGQPAKLAWAASLMRGACSMSISSFVYAPLLVLSVLALGGYEWNQDENVVTLTLLAALSIGLGVPNPRHYFISGLAVGAVVATINGFECLSGILPKYETEPQTLLGAAKWLVLIIPALLGSAIGREVGLRQSPL